MAAISTHVVKEFCGLCDAAYQASLVHRTLFDENPAADRICGSGMGHGYGKLSEITQEHALLQIAKLHDPVIVSGKITLGIAYVLTYGGWGGKTQEKLAILAKQLNSFAEKLRVARNQTLAHNDLAAIVATGELGAFEKDEDQSYFLTLQEFADIVSREVAGHGFSYKQHVAGGIASVAAALANAVDA